jgi:hypothetical protein
MSKITVTSVDPFTRVKTFGKSGVRIVVTIKYENERLSITADGYEGRRWSFGGQSYDELLKEFPSSARLVELWKEWHLNDLQAGCEHQRALGWTSEVHLSEPCPTCGYKYGTAWLFKAVPVDVLEELQRI